VLHSTVVRFALAGLINTSVSYAIFSILFFTGVSPYFSSASGYLVALCLSFYINKIFVFQSLKFSTFRLAAKFLTFNFLMLGLNLSILHSMMAVFGVGGYLSQGIALFCTAGLSFIFYRLIFRYEE